MFDADKEPTILKKEEIYPRNSFNPIISSEGTISSYKNNSDNQQTNRTIELTNENAMNYAGTASFVGWKGRVDYALKHLGKDSSIDASLLPRLLENVISTVILSARGGIPPDDYLFTTMLYLGCIRNEFGEHPPNIAAFLEHLKAKAPEKVLSAMESVGDINRLPPNGIITKVPLSLQESLRK